jgi:hypothetical protein
MRERGDLDSIAVKVWMNSASGRRTLIIRTSEPGSFAVSFISGKSASVSAKWLIWLDSVR